MSRRKQARPSRAHLEDDLGLDDDENLAHLAKDSTGEDNDYPSDVEDVVGVVADPVAMVLPGEEAVDLSAAVRSQHGGDEDEKDVEEVLEDEDVDEATADVDVDDPDDDEEGTRKRMRHRQDAENNNSFVEGNGVSPTSAGGLFQAGTSHHVTLEALQNTKVAVAQFAATALAGGADSEAALQDLALLQSTLYTLQHQQVFQLQLISQLQQQLSITHGQTNTLPTTPAGPATPGEPLDSKEASPSPSPVVRPKSLSSLTSPPSSRPPSNRQNSPVPGVDRPTPASGTASPLDHLALTSSGNILASTSTSTPSTAPPQMPPLCSISSSLASSIITNTDPPPLHEPNTLEMLQKRAQEVLENASQGLLANNLADELAFRSGAGKGSRLSPYDSKGTGGRGETFFKHRCRFCGKVFGSDSALQIHIRSHTGERPFKCNVCGSRFTTKGNLKVHFQRHSNKFPHVKMNPNPVPEHLDKYHPPLLQQIATAQRPMPSPPAPPPPPPPPITSSTSITTSTSTSFHSAPGHGFLPPQPPLPLPLSLALPGMPPLYRSPLVNHHQHHHPHQHHHHHQSALAATSGALRQDPEQDQDLPQNLSKPVTPRTSPRSPASQAVGPNLRHHPFHEGQEEAVKRERGSPYQSRPASRENAVERITPKREPEETPDDTAEEEDFEEARRYMNASPVVTGQAQSYEDCSMDSKISARLENDGDMEVDEDVEEQPENLSGRTGAGAAGRLAQPMVPYGGPGASPASSSASSGSLQTSFAGILFPGPPGHHQIPHHSGTTGGQTVPDMIDPAKDPAIYSSLLPRPGSNDNSWESLIEITKTSETSKLQQLVDNIEHKLTDPNQCVICHRVLSCKSALQMHYRTHTGERPFKCKICGRAFTTKGNLKTHMGVHRAKPPLRVLHQCPVCHKKFTNALVLQQHIRLHTGEPTDLSPEQIQAAEVNEFPAGYPAHHPLASFLPQGFPGLHGAGPAGFPLPGFPPARQASSLDRQQQQQQQQENELETKDEGQQQDRTQQQDRQRQGYMEQDEETEEQEDEEEEDRREEDERRVDDLEQDPEDLDRKELTFSTSLAALENQVRTITTTAAATTVPNVSRSPPYHRYNGSEKSQSPPGVGAPLDLTPRASSTPASVPASSPPPPPPPAPTAPHPFGMFAGLLQAAAVSSTSPSSASSSASGSGAVPASPINSSSGPLASLTTSAVLAATSSYNPLGLAVGGPAVRGNTTCNICYKTFACNSALEIHYRSHTKERPFKCSICDRGFSTKSDGSRQCGCARQASRHSNNCNKNSNRKFPDAEGGKRRVEAVINDDDDDDDLGGAVVVREGIVETPRCPASRRRRTPRRGGDERKCRGRRRRQQRQATASLDLLDVLEKATGLFSDARAATLPPPPPPPIQPALLAADQQRLRLYHQRQQYQQIFLGNMKQHMLTHKIRDMPPHLFSDTKQQQQQQQSNQEHESSRSPMRSDVEPGLAAPPPPPPPPPLPPPPPPMPPASLEPTPAKRSPPDAELPAPKRPASVPSKHLCQICNKNFSSSSALQIHMRTHTGDKPFRCTVCQKAFTTKGNLKVHMGTHMWTNGASRRGRRMSLDLPPLPITPKDSEFLQRRPDLFYPYLPAPFLNGVQQKLNEISVIQQQQQQQSLGPLTGTNGSSGGTGGNGLTTPPPSLGPAGKYAGLFGSVYAAYPSALENKQQQQQQQHLGPVSPDGKGIPTSIPPTISASGASMLFQTSSGTVSTPSTPSPPGANHHHHLHHHHQGPSWPGQAPSVVVGPYEREQAPVRPESGASPSPQSARMQQPAPPAPRGEGLAA